MGFFTKHSILFFTRARAHTRTENLKKLVIFGALLLTVSKPAWSIDAALTKSLQFVSASTLSVCLSAIETLGHSHDTDVVPDLIRALKQEKRPTVRRYLVDALGRLRSPESVPALTQALSDKNIQIRQSAVIALEAVGSEDAENALFQYTGKEKEYAVKTHLVGVLSRSKNPKAAERLKIYEQDSDPKIQALAQDAKKHHKKTNPKPATGNSQEN